MPKHEPSHKLGNESRDERIRREKFARALTRSVFGRHYWNEKLEEEKREAAKKKPKNGAP